MRNETGDSVQRAWLELRLCGSGRVVGGGCCRQRRTTFVRFVLGSSIGATSRTGLGFCVVLLYFKQKFGVAVSKNMQDMPFCTHPSSVSPHSHRAVPISRFSMEMPGLSCAFFVWFSCYKFTVRPLLGGLGLKSWGYDALNPLKEMPCSDRRFMAITKLELMGFLILLEIIQVSCVFFGFLSNVSKVQSHEDFQHVWAPWVFANLHAD